MKIYLRESRLAKKMTPQAVLRRIMQRVMMAETMKKLCGSPWKPSVPGPRLAANTLTRENAPDINPKPRPTT